MGKKAAAKKKGKAADGRGYATVSIASTKKEEETDEPDAADATEQVPEAAEETVAEQAAEPERPNENEDAQADDLEEWERVGEENDTEAASRAALVKAEAKADNGIFDEEEWERAVESRLDDEIQRCTGSKKFIPTDATQMLERRGNITPAGVVWLSSSAEQRVEAALAPYRDDDGLLKMIYPKHWRYKGKITYERLNGIYLALEALNFRGEQIRWAMEKTCGYDVRAALEFLLINLPKEDLPRKFGGESMGDDAAENGVGEAASDGPQHTENGKAAPDAEGSDERAPTGEAPAAEERAQEEEAADDSPHTENGKAASDAEVADESARPGEAPPADEPAQEEDRPSAPGPESAQEEDRPPAPAPEPAPEAQQPKQTATEKSASDENDFMKRWALQHAEGSDAESDELLDEEEKLDRERRRDPNARHVKISAKLEELMAFCKKLKEKKKQGAFKQNISADMQKQREATAKMAAIKRELEALESGKYGKINRELIGRPKAAVVHAPRSAPAAPAAPANPAPAVAEPAEAAEDDAAELPSIFDSDAGTAKEGAADPPAPGKAQPQCRVYHCPSYHGRTPKQGLEEFVRKRVFGKHAPAVVTAYERVQPGEGPGRHRVIVAVTMPRDRGIQRFDPDEPCQTWKDAENLAATYALMKLSTEADRPGLCRGLPPTYRQRWNEWEVEAANRLRESQRERVKSRIMLIERLLRTKPLTAAAAASAAGGPGDEVYGKQGGGPQEEWSVWNDEVEFMEMSGEAASRLRSEYHRRREALAGNAEFEAIQEARSRLPVAEYKDQLCSVLNRGGVLIVSGATGSGKTTQVPQFVLEDALERSAAGSGPLPNIIVTEPRRISAVSVAKRVSQEIGDPRGGPGSRNSLVGYQIRMEKRVTDTTRLLFCTVGVLLKQIQQGQGVLEKATHIFVDEVHERSAECDLMLLLLNRIRNSRPDLRIVVMSATMEVDKLQQYFGRSTPIMSIPGRTFPVENFWLEDAIELTEYRCEEDSQFAKRGGWNNSGYQKKFDVSCRGKTQQITEYIDEDDDWACDDVAESCDTSRYHAETHRTLCRMDHTRINFDLVMEILTVIHTAPQFSEVPREDGAVLIFLPGLMEITKMSERLNQSSMFGNRAQCLVISLHSVLSGDEHAKAFERPRRGVRKIVLSTNIAETGVTIPDVVFVIDSGKVKSQRYHEPTNTSSLKEQFVSKAEVMQRRGRAGRVQSGFSFCLFTQARFDLRFHAMPTPEILRCSLMELMLSILSAGLQPGCFNHALDPPPAARIDQALATLKATGAVEEGVRPPNAPRWGANDDTWYVATPIGQCLARLPCDLRLGKMVLLASLFGGVDAVLTIAATLSHRSPLATPFSDAKRLQAKQTHCAEFLAKDMPPSDHMALSAAYKRWEEAKKGKQVDAFCHKHWLNNQVLQTIKDIRRDLHESLRGDGFCEHFSKEEVPPQDLQSPHTVAALIFAGLFPNVARVDAPLHPTDKMPILSAGAEHLKLHPGSLCHGRIQDLHRTNQRWICYHTKMKTSQVFLRDCSFLAPHALLLFAGDTAALNLHPVEKSISIGLGGEGRWHTFHVAPRTVAMVRQLRYAFDALLRRKALCPRRPLGQEDRALIMAYIAIINSVDVEA